MPTGAPEPETGSRPSVRSLLTWAAVTGALLVVLAVLVAVRWSPLVDGDRRVASDAHRLLAPHPALAALNRAISAVGQPATFQVLAVVVAVLLLRARRVRPAVFVVLTVVVGGLWSRALKGVVDRPRPVVPDPVAHATGTSFPSGHAIGSATGVLALLVVAVPLVTGRARRVLVAAGAVVVVAVGASRVLLSVHWVSDVLGGWLLAATWTLLVLAGVRAVPGRPVSPRRPAPASPPGRPRRTPS